VENGSKNSEKTHPIDTLHPKSSQKISKIIAKLNVGWKMGRKLSKNRQKMPPIWRKNAKIPLFFSYGSRFLSFFAKDLEKGQKWLKKDEKGLKIVILGSNLGVYPLKRLKKAQKGSFWVKNP
jgi:thiamine kinase-like enzyme